MICPWPPRGISKDYITSQDRAELPTSPGQKEGQDPGILSLKEGLFKKLELNGPNSANLEPK